MGNLALGLIGTLMMFVVFPIVGLALYFIPTIYAYNQKKKNREAIAVLNFFLGWTFLGWVLSLIWAVKHED